jgi:PAS domain-containing protein
VTSLDVLKLIDVLPEAILLVSPQGDILAANAAAQDFLNLPAAELKQKNIAEFSVEPPEKIRNYLSLCSRTRQPIPGSLTLNL